MANRKAVTYDLKSGGQVVPRGTANNPEGRGQEHRDEGKKITRIVLTSRRVTEQGAEDK